MHRTSVLVIDDHPVVLEGLRSFLKEDKEFMVAAAALEGTEGLKLAHDLRPDIVVMGLPLSDMDGADAARRIKALDPDIHIVIFSEHVEGDTVVELIRVGVSGYILKGKPLVELRNALRTARTGGTWLDPEVATVLKAGIVGTPERWDGDAALERLSPRERELFPYLADGRSVKSLARDLRISPKTVECHKYRIMEKLHAETLTDLTKFAIRKKVISP